MNDAVAIISVCQRLLSNLQTLTETDARAAVAACEAWLNKNNMSRPTGFRFPPEILNAILRKIPYHQRHTLLSCSLVNKEWRRNSWPHYWKELAIHVPLAPTASVPWALPATKGIQVRKLSIFRPSESVDIGNDLALLFAMPLFSRIRVLNFGESRRLSTFHVLLALRSLPNLTYLHVYRLRDERVEWKENLRLSERVEEETWRIGLGNLKAPTICMRDGSTGGIMLDKLAMGLGARLESLSMVLLNDETEQRRTRLARLLQNVSQNCPHLVHLSLICWRWSADFLRPFFTTQHQLADLNLLVDVSDQLIQTILASCVTLKHFSFAMRKDVPTRCLQHLANGPFLRSLRIINVGDTGDSTLTRKDILAFLRHRGRDLEYLVFPSDPHPLIPLAPLTEFLPNIRTFGFHSTSRYTSEDVSAFRNQAKKLETFVSGGCKLWRSYAESKEQSWMGL
ncbi:hypothetical protein HK104_001121 [Borealophlyctis nickersoniae]|nr:hypothetical protein HK104_001121 [Borealophlyctis nickersoniae]